MMICRNSIVEPVKNMDLCWLNMCDTGFYAIIFDSFVRSE